MYKVLIVVFTCLACRLMGETGTPADKTEQKKEIPKEETVETQHSVKIGGVEIPYKATVGTQHLNDDQGNPKAYIFYVAYTKQGVENARGRPITFCFNGGPGSSSVWLHLGVMGPKRVNIDDDGKAAKQPYYLKDNPYSMLDETDLVFIDPVSTGYSRSISGEYEKQYHGVEADIQSVAEFIRLYVTRNGRWESPKLLAGESYGTTRASGLAQELHDTHHLYLDGIFLISTVLNFQTIRFASANDLPYVLFLPTYTATAWYHQKLAADLQKDQKKALAEVEIFAQGEYAEALMKGDKLAEKERKSVVDKLARYTGLSKEYIERANLRVNIYRFAKELLRGENRTVGRFDSRQKGIDSDLCNAVFEYDPSYENIVGLFTAAFNDYIRRELGWSKDEEYQVLADVTPWDYGTASNQYLDMGEKLKETMCKNNELEVYVASGIYDMATPYFATEYTFSHLGLDPVLRENVMMETYVGGHMMYLYKPSLVKMKEDMSAFMHHLIAKRNKVLQSETVP